MRRAMPDRLATRIVYAVLDALSAHGCLLPGDTAQEACAFNNATDEAIEEVEKLLRED